MFDLLEQFAKQNVKSFFFNEMFPNVTIRYFEELFKIAVL